MAHAGAILARAKNPLIVAGDGVGYSGAWEQLDSLARTIGAPVYSETQSSMMNYRNTDYHWQGELPGTQGQWQQIFGSCVRRPGSVTASCASSTVHLPPNGAPIRRRRIPTSLPPTCRASPWRAANKGWSGSINGVGDGASLFYPHTWWTAAKYGLPILHIIMNNREYQTLINGLAEVIKYYPQFEPIKEPPPYLLLREPEVKFHELATRFKAVGSAYVLELRSIPYGAQQNAPAQPRAPCMTADSPAQVGRPGRVPVAEQGTRSHPRQKRLFLAPRQGSCTWAQRRGKCAKLTSSRAPSFVSRTPWARPGQMDACALRQRTAQPSTNLV